MRPQRNVKRPHMMRAYYLCEIAENLCGGGNQIRSFDNTEGILLALLDPYCTDPAPNVLVRNHGTTSSDVCCQLLFCFVRSDILISGSTHFNGGIWFMAPSGK